MQYNTAAMKVLAAHDASVPLSVASVRGRAPFHPDASANHIALPLVLLPAMFHTVSMPLVAFTGSRAALHAAFIALKVAAVPVVLVVAYELQWLAVRAFRASGGRGPWAALCVLQRAVIEEPDDGQIEVAVLAVREAMALEAERGGG
jgi:uncharacterized protein YqhQ